MSTTIDTIEIRGGLKLVVEKYLSSVHLECDDTVDIAIDDRVELARLYSAIYRAGADLWGPDWDDERLALPENARS